MTAIELKHSVKFHAVRSLLALGTLVTGHPQGRVGELIVAALGARKGLRLGLVRFGDVSLTVELSGARSRALCTGR